MSKESKFILQMCVIILLFLFYFLVGDKMWNDYLDLKFEEKSSKIKGLRKIKEYLNYEDKHMATIELENGKEIEISGFDVKFTGNIGGDVFLDRIDDVSLICLINKNDPKSWAAVDINSLLEVYNYEIDVEDLNDLIVNYDLIYSFLRKNFSDDIQKAKKIRVANVSGVTKDHWCYLQKRGAEH